MRKAKLMIERQAQQQTKKRANFRRLAQVRTGRVLEDLRKLGNLASPNYEFENTETEKIITAIVKSVEEVHRLFQHVLNKQGHFQL